MGSDPAMEHAGHAAEIVTVSLRCTYCLIPRPASAFGKEGDHVIPSTLGGAWVDRQVCEECNRVANRVADQLVSKDPLVRFLRAFYAIPDRYGKRPSPPVLPLRLEGGGVIKAVLREDGPVFEAGLPARTADALGLTDLRDQARLRELVDEALGTGSGRAGSLELARIAQERATPPLA